MLCHFSRLLIDTSIVNKVHQLYVELNKMHKMLNTQEQEFDQFGNQNTSISGMMYSQIQTIECDLKKFCKEIIESNISGKKHDWYFTKKKQAKNELIQEHSKSCKKVYGLNHVLLISRFGDFKLEN